MELTEEQKDMLNGRYGEGTAYAMKIQVAIGESFDAPRMVPITRAHVALSNQDADLWFAEKLLHAGAHCRVSPTVNPGFCISFFKQHNMVSDEDTEMMQRTHNAYKGLGATLTYNCTPYVATNVPNFGEICAFSVYQFGLGSKKQQGGRKQCFMCRDYRICTRIRTFAG